MGGEGVAWAAGQMNLTEMLGDVRKTTGKAEDRRMRTGRGTWQEDRIGGREDVRQRMARVYGRTCFDDDGCGLFLGHCKVSLLW